MQGTAEEVRDNLLSKRSALSQAPSFQAFHPEPVIEQEIDETKYNKSDYD